MQPYPGYGIHAHRQNSALLLTKSPITKSLSVPTQMPNLDRKHYQAAGCKDTDTDHAF